MAGQSPRKAAPKDQTGAPKTRRFHIPTLATLSAELRSLLLSLCLMLILLEMIPVVALQFLHRQVIIARFDVPPSLAQRGLNADVVANPKTRDRMVMLRFAIDLVNQTTGKTLQGSSCNQNHAVRIDRAVAISTAEAATRRPVP